MSAQSTQQHNRGPAWVTALVVMGAALLLSRTGPGSGGVALGEMVSTIDSYAMMTTDGGVGEILVVVDSSEEMVLIYRAGPSGGIDLIEREPIDTMFARARAQSLGAP